MQNKNVLISGGASFIGSPLCDLLLENGRKVTVLNNFSITINYDELNNWIKRMNVY